MPVKLCVIMDPIRSIRFNKDTTLGWLLEAQKRQWQIFYLEIKDLFLKDNQVQGNIGEIQVHDNPHHWVTFLSTPSAKSLADFDIVLMRKDPPVDLPYLYTTYLLELAQKQGTFIVNDPRSLRDVNEKIFTNWFAHCCPPTVVSANITVLKDFLYEHQAIVVKPLNLMGGQGIFVLKVQDLNINATLELMTQNEQIPIIAQHFLSEISKGDKRILMIDGQPYPYALTRIPAQHDIRGNLAHGAKGVGCQLTSRDLWLCSQIGPTLRERGLFFVGLDVIGDYVTEINVTSPTCMREIERAFAVNISEYVLDVLTQKLQKNEK